MPHRTPQSINVINVKDPQGSYIRDQAQLLFKLVGIPLCCVAVLAFAFLYVIGGIDLLRFAFRQLFTWRGAWAAFRVVGGLSIFASLKHAMWYANDPPPMWFRRSVAVNILEIVILLLVISIGFWALLRFFPPPLPR